MDDEEWNDWLDTAITELCANVSEQLNDLARNLGVDSRVWYVTVINGKVIKLEWKGDSSFPRWPRRRIIPGKHTDRFGDQNAKS